MPSGKDVTNHHEEVLAPISMTTCFPHISPFAVCVCHLWATGKISRIHAASTHPWNFFSWQLIIHIFTNAQSPCFEMNSWQRCDISCFVCCSVSERFHFFVLIWRLTNQLNSHRDLFLILSAKLCFRVTLMSFQLSSVHLHRGCSNSIPNYFVATP